MAATGNGSSSQGPKSVLVTGGGSGIGRAMVEHFASQGHKVAILDVNATAGQEVAAGFARRFPGAKVSFHQSDVSSWEDLAAVFKEVYHQHGNRIDVVMANAGVSERGISSAADLEEETPSKPHLGVVNINLIGVVYTVKLATHYINKNPLEPGGQSRGSIICTSSNAGLYAFPIQPLYAATKSGVIGLVRSLERPLGRAKIQINALAPAVLETNIAPSKDLFTDMKITPMSTLTRGVAQFIENPTLNGEVAEIHGENVTIRPPYEYVDTDSAENLEVFWNLGYA